jgi:hypothetical protein
VSIHDDASHHVYILICTISVEVQPTMKVDIHNQCLDFELTCRGYFSSGADSIEDPAKEVDAGSMNSVGLMPSLVAFEGALMYGLERKRVKSSNQPEPTDIQLFIAWKSEGYEKFSVFVHLIEDDKQFYWRKATLGEYYQRYASQLCTYTGPIKNTWLIPDGTVLVTELELDFTQRDGVLNITISEGVEDEKTKRPEWIYLER